MRNLSGIVVAALMAVAWGARGVAQTSWMTGNSDERKVITVDTRDTVSYTRSVSNFTGVNLQSSMADVVYTQGDRPSMRIAGTRALVDNMTVKVVDGTLVLAQKENKTSYRVQRCGGEDSDGGRRAFLRVYVTVPRIDRVSIGGVGSFVCNGAMTSGDLRLDLRGVGSVRVGRLQCDRLSVKLSGVGGLEAGGIRADAVNVVCSGTGSFRGTLSGVERTYLELSGVGRVDARFERCGALKCTASGMGTMRLGGSVRTFEKTKNGLYSSLDTDGLKVGW